MHSHDRSENRLLQPLLAYPAYQSVATLTTIDLKLRDVLFDIDVPISHVYFPENSVVSIVSIMSDGSSVETASVGYEGMVGLPVFLGTDQMSAKASVRVAGRAVRMRVDEFLVALKRSPEFELALQHYTQALFTLLAQGSACNRSHTILQRCARWLLHTHDRVRRDIFSFPQQFLSQMLSVRRAPVTQAMAEIQLTGALSYEMGTINMIDRRRLEREVCECYAIVTAEFDRLLGLRWSPPQDADKMR